MFVSNHPGQARVWASEVAVTADSYEPANHFGRP